MKTRYLLCSLFCLVASGTANADGPPEYFRETLPPAVLGPLLEGYGALSNESAAIAPKMRELIALAVAAQIPCAYCVHAHSSNAKAHGASEEEIREAVATAGYVRLFSTALHGNGYDLDAFVAEHDDRVAKR